MSGVIGQRGFNRSGIIGPTAPNWIGFAAKSCTALTMRITYWETISFTERWDQGACYDGTTFTAPVTGRYFFNARIQVSNVNAGDECYFRFNSSNTTYYSQQAKHNMSARNDIIGVISVIADMDANDTMTAQTYNATGARGALSENDNCGFDGWLLG